ncbi:MAG TPA: hypothetical protein VGK67_29910 [Myxococcales bacterium]|jgi:hypothetical protein
MSRNHFLFLMPLACLVGCGPRAAPQRDSPEFEKLDHALLAHVYDPVSSELAWYDPDRGRVLRYRAGQVEAPQDVAVTAPEALRVFADGSFVVATGQELQLWPLGSAPTTWPYHPDSFDGLSMDDWWFVGWVDTPLPGISEAGPALCHVVHQAVADCVPFIPTSSSTLAVAGDGSVYVTDGDKALYRYADGRLTNIWSFDSVSMSAVIKFRRSGAGLLAVTSSSVYAIEEATHPLLVGGRILDALGTAGDFYYLTYDYEQALLDPSCRPSLFPGCATYDLWSQYVLFHVVGGRQTEVGHQTCTSKDSELCEYLRNIGFDGSDVVLLSTHIRRVASK